MSSASKLRDPGSAVKNRSLAGMSESHTLAVEQMSVVDEMFNPLRFIALHLKELNEQDKLEKAKQGA